MKVIAVNGSARRDGNTALLLQTVLTVLAGERIETEMIQLAGERVYGCRACYQCRKNKNRRCAIDDDIINACLEKLFDADGILLGSPTYFTDVTSEMKALIDRAGFVARGNGFLLKRKAGAAVVAVRRAGAIHAFDTMNHFFTINQMIVVGSSYWNIGIGGGIGEVCGDTEGIQTMKDLGVNMAWLLHRLHT